MFSQMQVADMIDKAFVWITPSKATSIVNAYIWAKFPETGVVLLRDIEVAHIKALIWQWLACSNDDVSTAVMSELNQT